MFRIVGKFRRLFDRRQKCNIVIIIILMVIGALLEMLGVSLIVPLISTIMNGNFIEANRFTNYINKFLEAESPRHFIILMLIVLIIIYIVKGLFLYFENYLQQLFICNNRMRMQRRLMESIMQRPYEYFLHESTSNIHRIIIDDINKTFMMLNNMMVLFTETVVLIALFGAVVMVDSGMAIFVCIVLSAELFMIATKVKPTMKRLGNGIREAYGQMNKWVIQAVEGIKEIKVSKKQEFFLSSYTKYATEYAYLDRKNQVLVNVPRLIIEAVTICSMLGLMIILLLRKRDMIDLLPQLSAFAVAAIRLLPSANRISISLSSLYLFEPNLDALIESMEYVKGAEGKGCLCHPKGQEILSLEECCGLSEVTYAYTGTGQNVLEHVSMLVPRGKSIGIVGMSGAGKTTAVDILLGLLLPQRGEVFSDGKNIMDNYDWWLEHLSYIPQTIYMLDDTIAANVAFGSPIKSIDEKRVVQALREAQLGEFIESLPDGIYTEIGERGLRISGGQRQRIGIARALYTNPELLVFDEATSSLDNETEEAIMNSINALHGKKTMIIIAHRLSTIQECDMIYKVDNKKIIREK